MRYRLTATASYRTAVSTATVTLAEVFVLDDDASRDDMIDAMKASLRAHARRLGDPIVGDIDMSVFEVDHL